MKVINENEFNDEVAQGLVVVDFFATWCGPCHIMEQVLEQIEEQTDNKVKIIKVDVDQSTKLTEEFNIKSIPTIMIYKDGERKESHIGVWQEDEIIEILENLAQKD